VAGLRVGALSAAADNAPIPLQNGEENRPLRLASALPSLQSPACVEWAMRTTHLLIPAVALITIGFLSAPASADQSRRRPAQTEGAGQAVRRGEAPAKPAARPQAARPQEVRPQESRPQAARPQESRPQEVRPQEVRPQVARPQAARPQARPQERRATGPRRDERPRIDVRRNAGPRYVPRREVNRVYIVPRRVYRPTYRYVAPPRFARSYFTFRPRLNIGFGLWLGYGVPYPYTYVRSYAPRVYGSMGVVRGVSIYGGVTFNLSPYDALVFVDGQYVGRVDDFSPVSPPLTLTPGLHRIEVQADGYQPMAWDVEIAPGQVIPYQGAMRPY